ncbi:23S rRNA (adenine(2503)-C(2))-methyltransferase RlmN [Chamaesiphon sp.]|uniref:23S rRNA (adenine(2503)-C(2))-methyltransferase RlmN n=1 Tax=Chamaesiphon sp. TaxID=2814140 RepID=UPI003593A55C
MSVTTLDPTTHSTTTPLLGLSLAELTAWVQAQGQPAYRGKQLYQWIYQQGAKSLADITVFSKQWRETVKDTPIGRSTIHHRAVSNDGTIKYLLQLQDGQIIEAVGIPSSDRLTVCVSSQVGCAMACTFCATGMGGFIRHLHPHEIIDQVLTIQEDFQERVSHVVFMGMGEPLANLTSVVKAVNCFNHDIGISQRSITVSTVGIPGKIHELAQHELQVTLAISLHAPNQKLRTKLVPTADNYPIDDLLDECRDYVRITGRRLSVEYVLLAGVNDDPDLADELASKLRGFQTHVNLIPYNPIADADFDRPTPRDIKMFVDVLEQKHIAVSVRYSKGLGATAACGQLRANQKVAGNS